MQRADGHGTFVHSTGWTTAGDHRAMPQINVRLRPYENDDPSEWEGVPAEWPHDEAACPVCAMYVDWTARTLVQHDADRKTFLTSLDGRAPGEIARDFPKRFLAIKAHQREVSRSRRAVDAARAREGMSRAR